MPVPVSVGGDFGVNLFFRAVHVLARVFKQPHLLARYVNTDDATSPGVGTVSARICVQGFYVVQNSECANMGHGALYMQSW